MAIPAAARILLALIYRTETGRDPPACYRTIIGHREGQLPKPVTSMTIVELLAAQKAWGKKWKSSAAGAPQIIRTTLSTLKERLRLSGAELFDADMQDRMAFELLTVRGWRQFLAGTISLTTFGNNLAREWASFPVLSSQQGAHVKVKRGQSYYDGDGLNSALIKPEAVEATLRLVLEAAGKPASKSSVPAAPKVQPTPQPQPAPVPESKEGHPEKLATSKRFWTWITTGGGTAAIPFVDWRVQMLIVGIVGVLAVYAIVTMPQVRAKLWLE